MLRWIFFATSLILPILCQEGPCPFHPCTPEQLGCPSSRLLKNKRGCLLCRCEESTLQDHPCSLHGCTVKLLNCASTTLRKDENGCDLCECSNPVDGNVTITMQPNPMERLLIDGPTLGEPTHPITVECPPLECPMDLDCERLAVNPRTGCEICRCATAGDSLNASILDGVYEDVDVNQTELEIQDPCPDPMEMVEAENMELGGRRGGRSKYKLILKKLKKGFKPGMKYKLIVKGSSRNPFKAFLVDVKPVPVTSKPKRRRGPLSTTATEADDETTAVRSCSGGGILNGSNSVRVSPDCPTAAIEHDTSNKTKAVIMWTAPDCGCVQIRAAVVDYTDRVVYMDDATAPSSGRRRSAQAGKINKPLLRTVCMRKNAKNRRNPPRRPGKTTRKVPKAVGECCKAAIVYGSMQKSSSQMTNGCEQQAMLFLMGRYRYNRFKGIQKTCKNSYRKCCMGFIRISNQPDVGRRPNKPVLKVPKYVLDVLLKMAGGSSRGNSNSGGRAPGSSRNKGSKGKRKRKKGRAKKHRRTESRASSGTTST
uniref:Uncharacterized protein LOC100176057 n=1 Tax=Phallusia mammillata TaxID=59560 RepID=A0A6F9DFU0_9ASCI|nr:uncharacterized protein LOC100176057 [Phallusia mammillata]